MFWWAEEKTGAWNPQDWHWVLTDSLYEADYNQYRNQTSAYTVAELGEILPPYVVGHALELPHKGNCNSLNSAICSGPQCWHFYIIDANINGMAQTEADARAKMLIYLIENKLVTAGGLAGR